MAGTTRLELATSAVTEWEHQVLPTTYKAVGDCQVLENTYKTNTSRVGHRVEKSDLKLTLEFSRCNDLELWNLGTEPLLIRCPFQYALANTDADPRCQASLVRSSSSQYRPSVE